VTGSSTAPQDIHDGYMPIAKLSALAVGVYNCSGALAHTDEESAPFPEVVLPQRGAYIRRDCAGAVYLDRTTIGFFEAGRRYTIAHPKPRPDVTTVISLISAEALSDALGLSVQSPLFGCSAVRAPPALQIMHRDLLRRLPDAAPMEIEERAVELATEAVALGHVRSNDLARRHQRCDVAVAVAEQLQESLANAVSLESLASSVGLSVFHLCRAFKARMGVAIHAYLLRLRFERATEMLISTSAPITDIALEMGFSSHAHFSAAFKRLVGAPPSTVRKHGAASVTRNSKISKAVARRLP